MLNAIYETSNEIIDFYSLKCDKCGSKLGMRKFYKKISEADDPTNNWNFCPICGSPLKEPAQ